MIVVTGSPRLPSDGVAPVAGGHVLEVLEVLHHDALVRVEAELLQQVTRQRCPGTSWLWVRSRRDCSGLPGISAG